jgi:hypothetical protein
MRETTANLSLTRRMRGVRRWRARLALAAALLLGGSMPEFAQGAATLTNNDLRAVVVYAFSHHDDLGAYKGRHLRVTGVFAHIDHADDFAASLRTNNTRLFEVVIIDQLVMPMGIANIYVACLLPKDHPFGKIADALPLGKEPAEFEKTMFWLEGNIDYVHYENRPADAQLNLKPGCTVTKR